MKTGLNFGFPRPYWKGTRIPPGLRGRKKSMRFKEYAVGKITKQNTTADVKPGEKKRQAAKFGNKIGKDGKDRKKIKGPKTNVLYNLGMAEFKCGEGEYFCRMSLFNLGMASC